MPDSITTFLSSVAVSTFLSASIVWLSRTWIAERLKQSIKSEYDQKLETHKAQLKATSEVELERLRTDLSILANKRNIQFTKLHNDRAAIVAELYKHFRAFTTAAHRLLGPGRLVVMDVARQTQFADSSKILNDYFGDHRLYFPEEFATKLDTFILTMHTLNADKIAIADLNPQDSHEKAEIREAVQEIRKALKTDVPEIREALEHQFRRLIGVEKNG